MERPPPHHVHGLEELLLICPYYTKLFVDAIPHTILITFFRELEKNNPRIYMEAHNSPNS
jgi:hypothetical protein